MSCSHFFRFPAINFNNFSIFLSLKDFSVNPPSPPGAVMSVSLSSIPAMLKDRSYHGGMLKGSPVRAFYPGHLPGPHNPYMDFFPRTNNLLNPLKSLGRLVSDTPAHLPLSLHSGAPPYLGHGAQHAPVLREPMLSSSGLPYLSQMLPGHTLYSKPEELAAVVTEHAAGPLSSDFSSPSSERSTSSSGSSSPPKESLYRFGIADPSPKKTRTSYNFTEDDLFMVLYGYSSNQERSVGHAISGVALPEKPGKTSTAAASFRTLKRGAFKTVSFSVRLAPSPAGQTGPGAP